ncbi:hypothetical protein ACEQ8H_004078 [Pleosporales sp. CAS-2024a]
MSTLQNMSSKRRRDDDSDSEDEAGFGHGSQSFKRSRPWFSDSDAQNQSQHGLPLRSTLTPPHMASDIGAVAPAHLLYTATDSPQSASGAAAQSSQPVDFDMDMDDDELDVRSQPQSPPGNNAFMRPAMLNASLFGGNPVNANGRVPTPIHPTFKRGGMSGLGFPTTGSAGGLSTNSGVGITAMQAPTSRKSNRQESEQDRSRRMPSPISEDEDIPDTPTEFTQSQLSRLSFSQPSVADEMDMEIPPPALALPPTPRGRKRSGALTGMGRFSMGYRDDCEKCRQRVPGHYSHFL